MKPTREEYFKMKQEEHNKKYAGVWESLTDWDREFLTMYVGIDGHDWTHALELLEFVKKHLSLSVQKKEDKKS